MQNNSAVEKQTLIKDEVATSLAMLSDEVLLSETKELVQKERSTTLKILRNLREIENRRLYAKRGYSSLYSYACSELAYTESQAHRRIASMRLITELPEIEAKIASGKMSLATVSQAQVFFKKEVKCTGQVRQLDSKRELIKSLEGQSKREVERSFLEICPQVIKFDERQTVLSSEYTKLSLTLTAKQEQLLNRLKQLKPDKTGTAELLEWLMERTLQQIDPLQKKQGGSPSPEKLDAENLGFQRNKPSRGGRSYIPSHFKKELWSRSGGRCEYQDQLTQRRCECETGLEIDHIQPVALGGGTELKNLRLLCREHNQLAAILALGSKKMTRYIKTPK